MTNQEAIKSFKNIIRYWTYNPTEVETCKLAIVALKKQIPEKPTHTYKCIDYYLYGECPNCGHTGLKEGAHKHCWWCGQAIDWTEWED